MDDGDNNDEQDDGREVPPAVSRLGRGGPRRYRVLSRGSNRDRSRDRFSRQRRQLPVEQLIGILIRHHGLTDEVRQRFVCLYWLEIAGARIASRTHPVSFSDGVLTVSATTSSWVHEMQFLKARVIEQIHAWIDARRVWLGPPPLVTDMRFVLGARQREPLVDTEHIRRLRLRDLRRLRPPPLIPPVVSDAQREAIQAETSVVEDDDLRATIERVRTTWNR